MADHQSKLKAGDIAPDFTCNNEKGKPISLQDFKGKKLVLYFYPKDKTPGCTTQACNLRDNFTFIKSKGYEILGVSADDETLHKKFIKKYDLPFSLLADISHHIIKGYDVWGEKNFMGKKFEGIVRTTFVIDEEGIIERIIRNIDTNNHTKQILD